MMVSLDYRLNQALDALEQKYECCLTAVDREKLIEGVVVGYSKSNTFENAIKQIEEKLVAMLNFDLEAV